MKRYKRYHISTKLDFWTESDNKPTKEEIEKYEDALCLWLTYVVKNGEPLPDGVSFDFISTTLWDRQVALKDNPIEEI